MGWVTLCCTGEPSTGTALSWCAAAVFSWSAFTLTSGGEQGGLLNSTPRISQSSSLKPPWHDSINLELFPRGLKGCFSKFQPEKQNLGSCITVTSDHFPWVGRKQSKGQPEVNRAVLLSEGVGWTGEVCSQSPTKFLHPRWHHYLSIPPHIPGCTLLLVSRPQMKPSSWARQVPQSTKSSPRCF